MSIQLRRLTEDLNIIQTLADQPTLTATELKQKFDTAGNKIKDYINSLLLDDIEDAFSDLEDEINEAVADMEEFINNLNARSISYDHSASGLSASNVQDAIDELKALCGTLNTAIGNVDTNANKKSVYTDFIITGGQRSDSLPPSTPTSAEYNFDFTCTQSGYYPIGIVGFHYVKPNVDSELLRLELTSRSDGRAVVTYKLRLNNTIDTTSHVVFVNILWVKIR